MSISKMDALKSLEQSLLKELAMVRELMGESPNNDDHEHTVKPPVKTNSKPIAEGKAKGDRTWNDYVKEVIVELGGAVKAISIRNYIEKAHPKMSSSSVSNAVSGALSELTKSNVLIATKSNVKKDGYTYGIRKEA